jgi:uncharacterized protein YtpQ (UPF0354 family)
MLPFTLSVHQIVPRIVLDLPKAVVPDMELSGANAPLERHLVADLSVTYAFDLPDCFKIVARRDLDALELREAHVHDLAMRNLSERMRKLEPEFRELSNGVFILGGAGDLTAAMLLLDDVWQQATERLREGLLIRGALVAAVPARDMVAFTCAENHRGLAFVRSRVSQVLEEGDHTLTRHFLVRRDKSWSVYEGYAG